MSIELPVFPLDTPAVRGVEIMPIMHQGRELLLVNDPMGVIERPIALAPDPLLLIVLQLADGKRTVGEMASLATQATGHIISAEILRDVVGQLDQALLLLSEHFKNTWDEKRNSYRDLDVRESSMFQAPPGMDRLAMLSELGKEFRRHLMSSLSPPEQLDLPKQSVRAIFAPHIDYNRGGELYSWAYKAITENGLSPQTFVILGVVHRPSLHRFIATAKTWKTPFGDVECDKELLNEFAAAFGGELFEDEWQHAGEHSIELQVVYLKKLMGDRPFRILPILVSSFSDLLIEDGSPQEADPEVGAFCKALRGIIEKHGDRIALIGGVDFSHCGPEFGDETPNSEDRVKEVTAGDRKFLDAVEAMDPERFFQVFRGNMNNRRVCSIGPMYCMLDALKGRAKAKILKYHAAVSADRNNLVSFSAVAFVKPELAEQGRSKLILLS